jgi:hypothetical protein
MMSPPPPAHTRRPNNTALIIMIILCCLVLPCGMLVVGGFWGYTFTTNMISPMIGCVTTFEQARSGLVQYAHDHEGKLPNAETWQDDIQKYFQRAARDLEGVPIAVEQADPAGIWTCKFGNPPTGIAFNAEHSGALLTELSPGEVLLFEVDEPRRNAHEVYKKRPRETSPKFFGEHRGWITMPVQGRHQGVSEEFME